MNGTRLFTLPDSLNRRRVIQEIAKSYPTKLEKPIQLNQVYYDSFDWLLYNNGLLGLKESQQYHLLRLDDESSVATVPWKMKKQPKFWWDFPDGAFKDKLKSCLDIRALIPLAELDKNIHRLRILNKDEKTVLLVLFEEIQLPGNQQKRLKINLIKIQAVRGYVKDFQNFLQFIRDLGIETKVGNSFAITMQAIGKQPGDYSSKLNIALNPDMPGDRAVKIILKRLFEIMKQNEEGLKSDIDTEFLHDFRVSVRRTRSALRQLKRVFPQDITDRFRQYFRSFGECTNRLRDLDVYLLNKEKYKVMLPEQLRPGLNPFFRDLIKERRVEHRKVIQFINSTSYQEITSAWEVFLNAEAEDHEEAPKNSSKPAIKLAQKFIFKKYKQVMDFGTQNMDTPVDEELHRLRIECKKLRYLLEVFATLFPPDDMVFLIKQLKKLQDNLGDFNDLCVQQAQLRDYLKSVEATDPKSIEISAAIGGLISVLFQEQQRVRKAFSQTFHGFSEKENDVLFRRLFG